MYGALPQCSLNSLHPTLTGTYSRTVLLPVLMFAVMGGKMAQPGSSYSSSSSRRLCEHAGRPIRAQGVSGTGRMLRLVFQEGVGYYLGGTLPSAWE